MKKLPEDLNIEILSWLPGSKATSELRHVCRLWDDVLRKQVIACCVHRYCDRVMRCRIVYTTGDMTLADIVSVWPESKGCSAYYVPHCEPLEFSCGDFVALRNPDQDSLTEYKPAALSFLTKASDLDMHRLLISDRCETDSYFSGEDGKDSFPKYMQLLLRYQVKHQEYNLEHLSRMRLLRTYIYNLEHRVSCKLRLLLEHIGYLCIRHMVLLLPHLEKTLRIGNAPKAAIRNLFNWYRSMQEQIETEKVLVGGGYHAPVKAWDMQALERYAAFLNTSDEALESYVDLCKLETPAKAEPCNEICTSIIDECKEVSVQTDGDEPKFQFIEDEDETSPSLCVPDISQQPAVEAMLKKIVSLWARQRSFGNTDAYVETPPSEDGLESDEHSKMDDASNDMLDASICESASYHIEPLVHVNSFVPEAGPSTSSGSDGLQSDAKASSFSTCTQQWPSTSGKTASPLSALLAARLLASTVARSTASSSAPERLDDNLLSHASCSDSSFRDPE